MNIHIDINIHQTLSLIINNCTNITMSQYSEMSAVDIRRQFKLPKLAAKKIEEANNFIRDPNSTIKQILAKHIESARSKIENLSDHKEEEEEKEEMKTKRYTHMNANVNVDASAENNGGKVLSSRVQMQEKVFDEERNLISLKMRKFKPTNSSFTQFYGEKLSIGENRSKQKINLKMIPELNFSKRGMKSSKVEKSESHRNRFKKINQTLSTETIDASQVRSKTFRDANANPILRDRNKKKRQGYGYGKILDEIRFGSEILRDNSRELLRKAEFAYNYNERSYEKLRDESNRILTGEEKFQLDDEFKLNPRSMNM